MSERVPESQITVAVARWLGKCGWTLVAMAMPGGGSGITFYPSGANPRVGKSRAIVPDVIVRDTLSRHLAIECKPRPNFSDAEKLLQLRDNEYADAVMDTLHIPVSKLLLAQAFGPLTEKDLELSHKIAGMLNAGLQVNLDSDVSVIWDPCALFRSNAHVGGETA